MYNLVSVFDILVYKGTHIGVSISVDSMVFVFSANIISSKSLSLIDEEEDEIIKALKYVVNSTVDEYIGLLV